MPTKAISHLVFGCMLIAFGPFLVEFSEVEAMTTSFYRMAIGAVIFLGIAWLNQEKMPQPHLLWLYLLAGLMTAFDLLACNQSILYIGSGLATVLSNLEVVFLFLLGMVFFREKLPHLFLPKCIFIGFGICCLMQPYFLEIHPQQLQGIILALVASLIYSVYLVLLKIIEKNNPVSTPATTLGIVCFFGATILGAWMTWHPTATFSLLPNWHSLCCILAYSIVSQVCGWWLITQGLKYVDLSVAGVIFLTQPALTFICDCIFLRRNTHWLQLGGGVIFLVAVYITAKEKGELICQQT